MTASKSEPHLLREKEILRFEAGFASSDPIESLRTFARELSSQGKKQKVIYRIFHAFYTRLMEEKRGNEENILGDVMDMIVDEYSPFNLNLPKQKIRKVLAEHRWQKASSIKRFFRLEMAGQPETASTRMIYEDKG